MSPRFFFRLSYHPSNRTRRHSNVLPVQRRRPKRLRKRLRTLFRNRFRGIGRSDARRNNHPAFRLPFVLPCLGEQSAGVPVVNRLFDQPIA